MSQSVNKNSKTQILQFDPDGSVLELDSFEQARLLMGANRHVTIEVFRDAIILRGLNGLDESARVELMKTIKSIKGE